MRNLLFIAVAVVVFTGCETMSSAVSSEKSANPLKVAVYADKGSSGVGAAEWYRIVDDSPDMALTLVDGAAVRAGALEGQDLLVMPGGSSKDEYASLGVEGVEKMRAFVSAGGGYIGTCAGCCLLMDGEKRARMMPWNSTGSEKDLFFPRMTLNEAGAAALGVKAGTYPIRYHGGPFLWPTTNRIGGASFAVWGTLDSEATYRGKINAKKRMYGSAAMLGGTYGKGRVFVTALHPEYFESTEQFVAGAFRFVTGRTVRLVRPQRRRGDVSVGFVVPRMSVRAAEDSLRLRKIPGAHVWVINGEDIFTGALGHVEMLVAPGGVSKLIVSAQKAVRRFVARGGKLVSGVKADADRGAVVCPEGEDIVEVVKGLVEAK